MAAFELLKLQRFALTTRKKERKFKTETHTLFIWKYFVQTCRLLLRE